MFEIEDDVLLDNPFVCNFRQKLQEESLSRMKDHFYSCMTAGEWFNVPSSTPSASSLSSSSAAIPSKDTKKPKLGWRFCKLSVNHTHLYSKEFPEITKETPEVHTLTDRLDFSTVSQFLCNMPFGPSPASLSGASSTVISKRVSNRILSTSGATFSFLSDSQTHLLDLICPSAKVYFEWIDGFRLLMGKPMSDLETFEVANALTETLFQIRCLPIRTMNLKVTEYPIPEYTNFMLNRKDPATQPTSFLNFYYQDKVNPNSTNISTTQSNSGNGNEKVPRVKDKEENGTLSIPEATAEAVVGTIVHEKNAGIVE